jgi:hypothetical protein
MVGFAAVRVCKTKWVQGTHADIYVQLFWLYVEAATAVVMASCTAYRTVFVRRRERRKSGGKRKGQSGRDREWLDGEQRHMMLPQVPRAVLSSVGSLVRGHHLHGRDGVENVGSFDTSIVVSTTVELRSEAVEKC